MKLRSMILCLFAQGICFVSLKSEETAIQGAPMKKPLPPFSELACSLKNGVYRHYSGKTYQVLGVGRHSETLEEYVIYKALYGDGGLWMRPVAMFCEMIEVEGKSIPRFSLIE